MELFIENKLLYIICLICGEIFYKGESYPFQEHLYDRMKMVQVHIEQKHGSMLDYLLNMNPDFLGFHTAVFMISILYGLV